MSWKEKYNPAIPKRYLFLLAGFIWLVVGAVLSSVGCYWIANSPVKHHIIIYLLPVAFTVGIIKGKFVLYKAADRTSKRIYSSPERACFGSVFSWGTWMIIALMVSIGQILRRFIVPLDYRDYLGLVYILIGLALATSSLVYWKNFFQYSKRTTRN
ncbi:MAG: hypothetical protein HZA77_11225 [Candidatus Schekmanbacteria bacterium]|nr:hypothetical protein [Candidatus Schekmanbacteria bacterium]